MSQIANGGPHFAQVHPETTGLLIVDKRTLLRQVIELDQVGHAVRLLHTEPHRAKHAAQVGDERRVQKGRLEKSLIGQKNDVVNPQDVRLGFFDGRVRLLQLFADGGLGAVGQAHDARPETVRDLVHQRVVEVGVEAGEGQLILRQHPRHDGLPAFLELCLGHIF